MLEYKSQSVLLELLPRVLLPLSDTLPPKACRTLASAEKLSHGFANAHPISLDVTNSSALDTAVANVDLVISLIPYTYHVDVIKSAIKNKKNVVTTSYVSPAMKELDEKCREAGITVMNEIGVRPAVRGARLMAKYLVAGPWHRPLVRRLGDLREYTPRHSMTVPQ